MLDFPQYRRHLQVPGALQDIEQSAFAELIVVRVRRLRNSVTEHCEHVTALDVRLPNATLPLRKHAKHSGRGVQPLHCAVGSQEQRRRMTAVHVTEAASRIVVGRKENGCVALALAVAVQMTIYVLQYS